MSQGVGLASCLPKTAWPPTSFLEDIGKGYARLDADDLQRLHAVPGDMLLITGRRSTVARAAQAPPSHCGQFLVMLDGNTRDNAQAGIDEYATVRKVPFKVAESVLLAPVQAGQPLPTTEEIPHLRQLLLNPASRIVAMSFCEPRSWTRVLSS